MHDPYDLLADFAGYLSENGMKPNQLRQVVKTAKKFLRGCKIKIDNEDFLEQVPLPRQQVPDIDGIGKNFTKRR